MIRGTYDNQDVTEQEIADLRRIVDSGLRLQRWPFQAKGESVMIEDGPLSGITGVLGEDSNKQLFILSIGLIHEAVALNADPLRFVSFRSSLING